MERRYTKERILEFYMNSVYFGAGAYGVKAAAEEYFGKELNELETRRGRRPRGPHPQPVALQPAAPPRDHAGEKRRRDPRDGSRRAGSPTIQAELANRPAPRCDRGTVRPGRSRSRGRRSEAAVAQRPDEFAFLGDTPEERKKAVFGCPADDVACEGGGGLQVFTTIDLGLQKKANEILPLGFPFPSYEENLAKCRDILPNETDEFLASYAETHSCVPTGAMTMVDNHTGAVKVMASGLPFEFSNSTSLSRADGTPGPSFKPFGLVAALEQGYTMGHTWSGKSPIKIECPFPCAPNGSNIWTVHNAGDSYGVITLEQATYNSVNAVYAQLSLEVGPENVVDVAHGGWESMSRHSTRCSPSSSEARR